MSLDVELKGNDNLGPLTDKIAASMLAVADREAKVKKLADSMGKSFEDVAKAVSDIERKEMQQQANDKAFWSRHRSEDKRSEGERKKMLREALQITAAFTAAGLAATALGYAIGASAKEAGDAKANATAAIGAWTGGDGPRSIKLLDKLAGQLGEKFSDVRSQFLEFRQAGLDNSMAIRLIKLRADLVATGLSAEQANKEIQPVLSAKNDKQRAGYISEIARDFGVVGDGAQAARSSVNSLDAGLNRLDNVKTKVFEQLWTDIGPSIGLAANEVARFAREFFASREGQQVIEAVGVAFKDTAIAVVDGIRTLSEYKSEISSTLVTLTNLGAGLAVGLVHPLDSIAESFKRGYENGSPYAETNKKIAESFKALSDWVGYAYDIIAGKVSDFYDLGVNVVSGFVDGIKSKISSAVSTIKDFSGDVMSTFKDALGIHSPSKVFAGYGENVVEGFEQGQQEALSPQMPITSAALAGPSSSGGGSVSITIEAVNINGVENAQQDWPRIRDEIQRAIMAGLMSRGYV